MMKQTLRLGWLVMAAALTLGLGACSSDEDVLQEKPGVQPEATTVHVTVKAGIDNNSTRSAVVTADGKRTLSFTSGDRLYFRGGLWGEYGEWQDYLLAGYLPIVGTPTEGATTATFSGDLSLYKRAGAGLDRWNPSSDVLAFDEGDPFNDVYGYMAFLVHRDAGDAFQVNATTLRGYYAKRVAPDVNTLMTTCLPVYSGEGWDRLSVIELYAGEYYADYSDYSTDSGLPIFNCNVRGLAPNKRYELYYLNGEDRAHLAEPTGSYSLGLVTADADGRATFACATLPGRWRHQGLRFKNTTVEGDIRTVYLGEKSLWNTVYNISRAAVFNPNVEILPTFDATLTSETGDLTLSDGMIFTGTGGADTHVIIPDGATVTLYDVNISNLSETSPAITCQGDATLVITGTNTVTAKYSEDKGIRSPGIFVPSGSTLTIVGDGSLAATGGGGAGIGGGSESCGNIVIESGTITATGTYPGGPGIGNTVGTGGDITITGGVVTAQGQRYYAGIGAGFTSSCGNITISGGTVSATGGQYGAGIGGCSGVTDAGHYGDITITNGVTRVTATHGSEASYSIGSFNGQTGNGTITIGGIVKSPITTSPYIYTP